MLQWFYWFYLWSGHGRSSGQGLYRIYKLGFLLRAPEQGRGAGNRFFPRIGNGAGRSGSVRHRRSLRDFGGGSNGRKLLFLGDGLLRRLPDQAVWNQGLFFVLALAPCEHAGSWMRVARVEAAQFRHFSERNPGSATAWQVRRVALNAPFS